VQVSSSQKIRGRWGSGLGFALASAGAAVGLGNLQRFPYVVSQHGGGAFVVLYLLCIAFLALPLMLVEYAIGRHTQLNPMCAIEAIRPNSKWKLVGLLGILTAFFILSYYMVIGGWTLGYIYASATEQTLDFKSFTANPISVFSCMLLFLLITSYIVSKGVKGGIERASKIVMPLLIVLLLVLVVRCLGLPGAAEGLRYYLWPDFSKLDGTSLVFALSQAFFSLCIGEAVLVTYGSYASKKQNLLHSALSVAAFDTFVALAAGFVIFPALFTFQMSSGGGLGLTFEVLPKIFASMPLGSVTGTLFFVLLAFAALTTSIALLEIPVIYLVDAWRWPRARAVKAVTLAAFIAGIPSALSCGASEFWTSMEAPLLKLKGFYEIMDFIWGGLGMALGGGLLAIFAGWIWGTNDAAAEICQGCPGFRRLQHLWGFLIKFVAPALIFVILASMLI